ncbi:MAG: hypothetical protein ACOC12_02360 [Bacteroidota bacterium]
MKKIQPTNYSALVLVRQNAFYQWLAGANRSAIADSDNHYEGDFGTYLVEDLHTQEDVYRFIDNNYKTLLENELREWHEPEFWPKVLSREVFVKFFEVQVHRQVYKI